MPNPYRKSWAARPTDEIRNDPAYIRSRAAQGALLDTVGGPSDLANYLSDYFYSGLNSLLDVGGLSPYNVPQSLGTTNRRPIPGGAPQLEQALVQSGAMRPGTGTLQETAMRMGLGLLDPTPVGAGSLTGPRGKNVFYSGLLDTAQNAPMQKGSADQWMGYLQNQPGVKQAELEWTAVEDWLKSKDRPVTRQELEDYLQGTEIQVQEVVKSSESPYPYKTGDEWQNAISRAEREGNFDEADRLTNLWEESAGFGPPETPKFAEYTYGTDGAGGENYRELLLTVPGDRYREDFVSGHWQEPNVVAHVRFNDRTTPEGERVLFLEEIQSDWAQEGRKEGFKEIYSGGEWKVLWEDGSEVDRTRRYGSEEEALEAAEEWTQQTGDKAVAEIASPKFKVKPEPFVRNTEQWTSLALKRMMKYAADHGYDRIAWTPGSVQAERYNLSHHIDEVHLSGSNLVARNKNGEDVINTTGVTNETLKDFIGEELAEKLLAQPARGTLRSLYGTDTQVGGEGMKAFYDKIIPGVANKIGKKHGAKTEAITIETSKGPLQALSIPVTEKLKSAAQGGFPYYAVPLTVGGSGLLAEEQRRRRPVTSLLNP